MLSSAPNLFVYPRAILLCFAYVSFMFQTILQCQEIFSAVFILKNEEVKKRVVTIYP